MDTGPECAGADVLNYSSYSGSSMKIEQRKTTRRLAKGASMDMSLLE